MGEGHRRRARRVVVSVLHRVDLAMETTGSPACRLRDPGGDPRAAGVFPCQPGRLGGWCSRS